MSTNNPFAPAVRQAQKGRILITGLDGAGKTHTAIEFAHALGERIAVIDTEFDRAKLEADVVGPFDHMTLSRHEPRYYIQAIEDAVANGYDVAVIDSYTHAWKAILAAVDATTNSSGKQDGRQGWRKQRPEQEALVRTIIHCPIHVIATARSKREVDWEDDKKRSLGLVPIADPEVRFDFDLVIDMDREHTAVVSKVRGCHFMDGRTERKPTRKFLAEFKKWLDSGAVNTDALARELLAIVGPEGKTELGKQMKAAKLSVDDLADEAKLAKARKIAEKIKTAGTRAPAEAGASSARAGGVEPEGGANHAPGSPVTRREPDDPQDADTAPPIPGQESMAVTP